MSVSEFYNEEWYDERWRSLPPVMRKIAADAIKKSLDDVTVELIKQKHAEHGADWMHHLVDLSEEEQELWRSVLLEGAEVKATMSGHHSFGMQIRNLLRDDQYGAGILDDDLPEAPYEDWQYEGVGPRNWDDYYIQAIEAAVGLREV